MNNNTPETPAPEVCASKIFELSGSRFAPDVAVELWPRIMQHKWVMSEKLGRDVGLRTACIDYVENMEQARKEFMAYKRVDLLNEMGAQTVSRKIWKTISDSQPPKQLIDEYLFQKVAQLAFEREYASKEDYRVTTDTFAEIVAQMRPSLTDEMIEEFSQDCVTYTRT